MANQDNVVSLQNKARERTTSIAGKLVSEIRQNVIDTLPKMLQSLYEKLDDGLFEQALFEKAGRSDVLDNLFFETMREIRKKRDAFINRYLKLVLKEYDEFWSGQKQKTEPVINELEEDNLSLLEEEDFEEDLAVENMAAMGQRKFSKELFALDHRFAFMKHLEELEENSNPLSPKVICEAFPRSIETLEIDLRIRLVIYKLFEKEVVHYLGAFYDQINALLKEAGVLSKLPSRVKTNPVSPALTRYTGEGPSGAPGAAPGTAPAGETLDEGQQAQLFNTLQNLLHHSRSGQAPADYVNLPKIETTDLLSALSGLQMPRADGDINLEDAAASVSDLRQNLSLQLNMGAGGTANKAFNEMDEDTIDVISMLFEFILEDTNLPDAMKALLSRLQIPMLKVAIIDRQFFSNKQHPARRLLNLLAKSAVGWVDDGDRSENTLFGRISNVVTKVLDDFKDDVELFNQLYEEFNEFVSAEEQGAEIVEERIAEVSNGRDRMKVAQAKVAEVVNSRVKVVEVLPEVIKDLFRDAWKDVLTLTYLRQGEDSEQWSRVVSLVDQLLWSVQPKQEQEERQKLLKKIPELLKAVRDELVAISYDQHKLGRIFKDLQACHIHALKGVVKQPEPEAPVVEHATAVEPEKSAVPENKTDSSDIAGDKRSSAQSVQAEEPVKEKEIIETPEEVLKAQQQEKQKDEYSEQAQAIKLGQWLEWTDENGAEIRGKLSWKSTITGTLIFVGRKGTKLAELSIAEVAELLRQGKAKSLQETDQPLLERAMKAMVDVLQKNQPQPS